ncbi:MAG: hypothetical protein U0869_03865 [Chloroflexota bacterium]
MFHSCSNVHELLGDLVDAGVDVIDPLQPEAMDLGQVARELGGQVAFAGGIPVQRLPSMTPEAVRDEVARLRDTLGAPFETRSSSRPQLAAGGRAGRQPGRPVRGLPCRRAPPHRRPARRARLQPGPLSAYVSSPKGARDVGRRVERVGP